MFSEEKKRHLIKSIIVVTTSVHNRSLRIRRNSIVYKTPKVFDVRKQYCQRVFWNKSVFPFIDIDEPSRSVWLGYGLFFLAERMLILCTLFWTVGRSTPHTIPANIIEKWTIGTRTRFGYQRLERASMKRATRIKYVSYKTNGYVFYGYIFLNMFLS